jgi:hypothetical protein
MESADDLALVARRYFDAAVTGNVTQWAAEHLGDEARIRLVGTDHDEVLTGDDAIAHLLSGDGHVRDATVDLLELEAFRDGSVGWVFAVPRLTQRGHSPVEMRWTAVFVRPATRWKLVQIHVSQARRQSRMPVDGSSPRGVEGA